jgi:Holliday junction resolvasome RuvABC DNA-binding subunit
MGKRSALKSLGYLKNKIQAQVTTVGDSPAVDCSKKFRISSTPKLMMQLLVTYSK